MQNQAKMKEGSYELWFMSKYGTRSEKMRAKKKLARRKSNKSKTEPKHRKQKHIKQDTIKVTKPKRNSRTDIWIKDTRNKLIRRETPCEKELYSILDTLNIPFEKQKPYCINGRIFFADAVFMKTKTVVEIDGGYHNMPHIQKRDAERTRLLNGIGFNVVRITNDEVFDRGIVFSKLEKYLPIKLSAYQFVED